MANSILANMSVVLSANATALQSGIKAAQGSVLGFQNQVEKLKGVDLNSLKASFTNQISSIKDLQAQARGFGAALRTATDTGVIRSLNSNLEQTQAAISRIRSMGKSGFDSMGQPLREQVGLLGQLQQKAKDYQAALSKASTVGEISKLNAKLEATSKELSKLANAGKSGFDALGNPMKAQLGILGELQQRVRGYQDALTKAGSVHEVAKLNTQLEKTNQELTRVSNAGKAGFNALGNPIKPVLGLLEQLQAKAKNIQLQISAAPGIAEVARLNAELEETNQEIAKIGNAGKKGFDDLGNKADAVVPKLDRLAAAGARMKGVGQSMSMYLTAPLTLAGGLMIKTAGDFEGSMKRVEAITGSTGKELQELTAIAERMGLETKYSASEAAGAMQFLGMAGFDAKETIAALPDVLNLAAAGAIDLARSADIVSNVMGQYGIEAANTSRVTNLMAATISSSNTNIEQLAEAFKYLGPTAKAIGITIEDTAAMIGIMGDAGIQGSLAGRALGTSLISLANPTAKAAAAMKALGLSAFDAKGDFVGMPSLLKQIEEGSKNMTQQQRAANLQAMLGAEAFQEINILLERGSSAYAAYSQKITGTNKAQAMAIKQSEGFNGMIKTLASAFEGVQLAIANSGLLELGTNLGNGLAESLRSLSKVNPELLKFGTIIAAAAAATGPLLLGIGTISAALPFMSAGFAAVSTAAAAAWTAILGPVGLVIAGVAAVGAAVYLLSEQFPSVEEKSKRATKALQDQVAAVRGLETDIKPLVARYEELKSQTTLSAEEQEELRKIVAKIATEVPGATTKVDEYGRTIEISTDKVKKFREEQEALEQSLRTDALKAKTKEVEDYEKQLEKIQRKAAKGVTYKANVRTGEVTLAKMSSADFKKLGDEAEDLEAKIKAAREERRKLFLEGQEGMGPIQTVRVPPIEPLDTKALEASAAKASGILIKLNEQLEEVSQRKQTAKSAGAIEAANIEIASIEERIKHYNDLGEAIIKQRAVIRTLNDELKTINNQDINLGDEFQTAAEKAKAYQKAIEEISQLKVDNSTLNELKKKFVEFSKLAIVNELELNTTKAQAQAQAFGKELELAGVKAGHVEAAIKKLIDLNLPEGDNAIHDLRKQLEQLRYEAAYPITPQWDTPGTDGLFAFIKGTREAKEELHLFGDETGYLGTMLDLAQARLKDFKSQGLSLMSDQIRVVKDEIIALKKELDMRAAAESFRAAAAGMIGSGLTESLTNLAAAAGNALGGVKTSAGDLANAVLGPIADMAVQLGKYAIGVGIGVEAIKKSLASFTGVGAIAAGVALVALGSAAKSALSGMASGGGRGAVPSLSGVSGSGGYRPVGTNYGGKQTVEFVLKKGVLVAALDLYDYKNRRQRGG